MFTSKLSKRRLKIAKSTHFMKTEVSPAVEWSWKYDDVGGYFTLCGASIAIFDISEHQHVKERTGTEREQRWEVVINKCR